MTQENSIWQHLAELTAGEREALVESAVAVLNEKIQPGEEITSDVPASVIRNRLLSALSDAGIPASQEDASAVMSLASQTDAVDTMLATLAKVPDLSEEIERAYRQRQEMMFLDMGILTGPALILLLLKVKRIRINSSGVDAQFYDAQESAVGLIRRMLGL